jgi:ribosomal protein bL25 (Ctc-form)
MEHVELRTESRTVYGKKVKRLRAENLIPAVVYGPDLVGKSIQIEERPLFMTLQQAGSTALINLFVDDEPKPHVVLAREIQRDPLTSRVQHVDFYEVRLTETVRTTPRIEIVGESPLVKAGQAVLIHGMTEIEVECLPTARGTSPRMWPTRTAAPSKRLKLWTVAVVHLAFFGVVENVKRRLDLLELLLCTGVIWVKIGMVLTRQLAIRFADVVLRCRPA